MEQLKLAVTSIDVELTDEILADIEKVHLRAPNLCP
jgi:aryl-alcohol dehydrogenase-like predicted oxidoreductase